jgi:putative DNA methylase
MAVFSRNTAVLESDDAPMSVKTALALINQELDTILIDRDADYEADTRFAVAWFEQHGHQDGPFGEANTLANAKGVSVAGVQGAGILFAKAGRAHLLRRDELPNDWDPEEDGRLTVWEATQHLIKRHQKGGAAGAAALLALLPGPTADAARELAYRLYQVCERKKWAQEALPYNALVADWPEIQRCMAGHARPGPVRQPSLPFADVAAE